MCCTVCFDFALQILLLIPNVRILKYIKSEIKQLWYCSSSYLDAEKNKIQHKWAVFFPWCYTFVKTEFRSVTQGETLCSFIP